MSDVKTAPKPAPAKAAAPKPATTAAANAPAFLMLEPMEIPAGKRSAAVAKYPWADLKVGGAPMFVPNKTLRNFSGMASAVAKRLGTKFVVRDHKHGPVDGVAVWRVEGAVTPRQRKPVETTA